MLRKIIKLIVIVVVLIMILLLFIFAINQMSDVKYEYTDYNGNVGYSGVCYSNYGSLICHVDGGIVKVESFKRLE